MSVFNTKRNNEVLIKSVNDLPAIIDSSKVYFIDGFIDMGATEITVPAGGMYLSGHGYGISGLYTTENNHTMFKTGIGTYAGDFVVYGCEFYSTGTSSKIFDLDNDGNFSTIELNACNLGTFSATTTSLGNISNYRQVRVGDFAAINFADGFTFNGTLGGLRINDSILLANVAGSTFLKEGVGLSVTADISSNMNGLSMDATSTWCDFSEASIASGAVLSLDGFRTSATNPIPNISHNSTKALFRGCIGIENTFVGASWSLSGTVETTITTADTLTKLDGTFVPSLDAQFSSPVSNRLQYDGDRTIKVDIAGYIILETPGAESLNLALRQWDNSASTWIDLQTLPLETQLRLIGNRRGSIGISKVATLDTGDYIELWAETIGSTANITMLLGSNLRVNERSV